MFRRNTCFGNRVLELPPNSYISITIGAFRVSIDSIFVAPNCAVPFVDELLHFVLSLAAVCRLSDQLRILKV